MSCTVCKRIIDTQKEDHVTLNGSCGHTLHAKCWADRWLLNGGSCATCKPKLTSCVLISDPLDTADVEGGQEGAAQHFLTVLRSKFDSAVEGNRGAVLRQGLPVNELRKRGINAATANATIDDLIASGYTGKQLELLGYTWRILLDAGLSERTFKRFDASHFVQTFSQAEDLCSGDTERAMQLLSPAVMERLPDRPTPPAAVTPQLKPVGIHERPYPVPRERPAAAAVRHISPYRVGPFGLSRPVANKPDL